jgi:hypothetical protein
MTKREKHIVDTLKKTNLEALNCKMLNWKTFDIRKRPLDGWNLVTMLYKNVNQTPGFEDECGGILFLFEKKGRYKALLTLANMIYWENYKNYGIPDESILFRIADVPENLGGAERAND